MDEISNQRKIEQVAEILLQHPFCVALTGAGLSTQSGLPDFRSPGKGLWERIEKMPDSMSAVMTLQGFKEKPEAFYSHFRSFLEMILSAKPNPSTYCIGGVGGWWIYSSNHHDEWRHASPKGWFTKSYRNARHN